MIARVAVVGGESSGKTTLVTALAARYDEPWVAEYGRTLWEERGGVLDYEDLVAIAIRHVEDEEAAVLRARRFVFIDTTPLTTLWYSLDGYRRADPRLVELSMRRYDRTFLCAPDFAFVQDGARSPDDFRLRHDRWIREQLDARGMIYSELSGALEARTARVAMFL